jgi:dihydrofolate reductase
MGKVIVIQFSSLDGVVEDPDGREGTPSGGWAFRYGQEAVAGDKFDLGEVLDTGVLLLGRRTWELFSTIWPGRDDPFSRKMNAIEKLVVSRSGDALLSRASALGANGVYGVQAAIAALQTEPRIDWPAVAMLYQRLYEMTGSPVVALNRAVAVAETEGPRAALGIVDGLGLGGSRYLHSTRAELLRRAGDAAGAEAAYRTALDLATTDSERRFLTRRLSQG